MNNLNLIHRYRAFGLTIGSELEIAELLSVNSPDIDISIRFGNVPDNLENVKSTGKQWSVNDDTFLLHIKNVASYSVSNGSEILVEPDVGAELYAIKIFLLGSCIAAVLQQRRQLVLHASSFELGGLAYSVCGKSGTGKSTTTAVMNQRGARLISDDVSAIQFDPAPNVVSGYPQSKLSAKSLDVIEVKPHGMQIVGTKNYKYARPMTHLFCDQPVKLRAIFILGFGKDGATEARLHQVHNSEAIRLMRKNIYRRQYILQSVYPMIFSALGVIVSAVPIFKIERPVDGNSFDEVNKLVTEQIEKMRSMDEGVIDDTRYFA